MPDKYDPYRDALVVEESTVWPEEYSSIADADRSRVERALHSAPEGCEHLTYVRMHTGFHRQITVTPGDYERALA